MALYHNVLQLVETITCQFKIKGPGNPRRLWLCGLMCEYQFVLSSGLTLLLLNVFSKGCYLVLHQNKTVFQ